MFLEIFYIFLISAVEGIAEFLPVSSTAHIILLSHFLNVKLGMEFIVGIQLGAIFAVFSLYKNYVGIIFSEIISLKPRLSLIIAIVTLPTLMLGFILHNAGYLDILFANTIYIMAVNLIIGGILMLIFRKKSGNINDITSISPMTAFKIGLVQSISLIPGVSRSASVVFGGIFTNLSRRVAIELSFISGVPIILCATVFEVWHGYSNGTNIQSPLILFLSMFVSFVFAYLGIKILKALVQTGKDFEIFGIYRIIMGVVLFCVM